MPHETPFQIALREFVKAQSSSMQFARVCAELAIQHFEKHGDVVYCQQFLDAMDKNYTRRVAFVKWLAAHSPITMKDGLFVKDKSETAVPFDIEGALKQPFWDFAPAMPIKDFGAEDIISALRAAVRKFENKDRYTPHDPNAIAKLAQAKEAVDALAKANIILLPAPTEGNTTEEPAAPQPVEPEALAQAS